MSKIAFFFLLLSFGYLSAESVNCQVTSGQTIQSQIDNPTCQLITVDSGIFTENITVNRPITIQGAGQDATIIDGDASGSVVTVDNTDLLFMSDLTLRNGSAQDGGGIAAHETSIQLQRVKLSQNSATGSGGGIFALASNSPITLTIQFVTFSGNSAADGGGLHLANGVALTGQGVTYTDNVASNQGGALWVGDAQRTTLSAGSIKLDQSYFALNQADDAGGAVYLTGERTVVVSNTTFENNTGNSGGAIAATSGGDLSLFGSIVRSNQAGAGGGIFSSQGTLLLDDTLVDNNETSSTGGGVRSTAGTLTIRNGSRLTYNRAQSGAGIFSSSTTDIDRSEFVGNSATGFGGGLYFSSGTMVTIDDSMVRDNETTVNGGGILYAGVQNIADPIIVRDTIIQNNVARDSGGGIQGAVIVQRSAIINNQANNEGGGIQGWHVAVSDTTFSGNSASRFASALSGETIHVTRSTFVDNRTAVAIFADGSSTQQYSVTDSLFDNPDASANCNGYPSRHFNVLATDTSCTGVATILHLDLLADNGGGTLTHALLTSSPARGNGSLCGGTDQRGFNRPASGCDIGAFEADATPPTAVTLRTMASATTTPPQVKTLLLVMMTAYFLHQKHRWHDRYERSNVMTARTYS